MRILRRTFLAGLGLAVVAPAPLLPKDAGVSGEAVELSVEGPYLVGHCEGGGRWVVDRPGAPIRWVEGGS